MPELAFLGLNSMLHRWAEGLASDNSLHPVAAAVATWVNIGDPETSGLQQCLSSTLLVQMLLDQAHIESRLLPVYVELADPTTGRVIGIVGAANPHWSKKGTWSGHCALMIPSLSLVLDPTIGQCPGLDGLSLLSRQPLLIESLAESDINDGFRARGLGYIANYSVLDVSALPAYSHPKMAQQLDEIDQLRSTVGQQFRANVNPGGR